MSSNINNAAKSSVSSTLQGSNLHIYVAAKFLLCKDELEALRHSSEQKRGELSSEFQRSEEEVRHLRARVLLLEERLREEEKNFLVQTDNCTDSGNGDNNSFSSKAAALLSERARLERALEEAHEHVSEVKASWIKRIVTLETQVERLGIQAGEEGLERRKAEAERDAALQKAKELEACASLAENLQKQLIKAEELIREHENQIESLKNCLTAEEGKVSEADGRAATLLKKSVSGGSGHY